METLLIYVTPLPMMLDSLVDVFFYSPFCHFFFIALLFVLIVDVGLLTEKGLLY